MPVAYNAMQRAPLAVTQLSAQLCPGSPVSELNTSGERRLLLTFVGLIVCSHMYSKHIVTAKSLSDSPLIYCEKFTFSGYDRLSPTGSKRRQLFINCRLFYSLYTPYTICLLCEERPKPRGCYLLTNFEYQPPSLIQRLTHRVR